MNRQCPRQAPFSYSTYYYLGTQRTIRCSMVRERRLCVFTVSAQVLAVALLAMLVVAALGALLLVVAII